MKGDSGYGQARVAPITLLRMWKGVTENEIDNLGLLEASAVRELANIGLGNAMTALSGLTGRYFNMAIPNVDVVNLDHVPDMLGDPFGVAVGIYMPIEGDISGHMAFLFPWESAKELWNVLLGWSPTTPEEVDELCSSAVLEVGNIINSSFLNAISDMTGLKLHATPPMVSIDLSASIASSIVAEAQMSEVVALSIETEVIETGSNLIHGYFLCIPSLEGLRLLFAKLGIAEAA